MVATPPALDAATGEDRAGVFAADRDGDGAGVEVDDAQARHLACGVALVVRRSGDDRAAVAPLITTPPAAPTCNDDDDDPCPACGAALTCSPRGPPCGQHGCTHRALGPCALTKVDVTAAATLYL